MFNTAAANHVDQLDVDLRHTLLLIANALNYVGIDDFHHGHRVAYICAHGAQAMGWSEDKVQKSFFAGLIHDCGVSQTSEQDVLLSSMTPEHIEAHCERGFEALTACSILSGFAAIVRYHHTPWEILKDLDLTDEDKDIAALIFLSDRVDFLRTQLVTQGNDHLIALRKGTVAEEISRFSGTLFRPDLVEAMCELVSIDGFWYKMEPQYVESMATSYCADPWYDQALSVNKITEVATFLAKLVDAKSPFTYHHSVRVAKLAYFLCGKMQLSQQTCDLIYVAGLVHDIGKLRTPDTLLNKPGALERHEYAHIRRHTIDTELALDKVFPNSKICEWASNHHEFIDGSGYPYQKKGDELDLPSRIITFSDVFQALSQDRPYRSRMCGKEKLKIITEMVFQGKLDREVFQCALDNLAMVEAIAAD